MTQHNKEALKKVFYYLGVSYGIISSVAKTILILFIAMFSVFIGGKK